MRIVVATPPTIDVSAFAQSLAEREKTKLIADPSRAACEKYGFQTLYEMPLELQKSARHKLITDHIAVLQSHKTAVFDHSVIQWLADWMRWLWGETPTEEWEAVLLEAKSAVKLYDVIEHVSEGPAAGYDGYRWLDARNGAQIEQLMRHLYADLGIADRVRYAGKRG